MTKQSSGSESRTTHPRRHRFPTLALIGGLLAVVGLAIVLVPSSFRERTSPPHRQPTLDADHTEEHEKNLTPSTWFHQQRAYPGTVIPDDARLRGFAQALTLRDQAARGPAVVTWELAGPTNIGGRITAIGYHPDAPLNIYAGAADGGVFKSTDFGVAWAPLFDDQNTLSIGAIAIHPNDAEHILVGTGEANASGDSYAGTGIYRSTDGGNSWGLLGLSDTHHIGRIVFDPQHPDTVYVAALGHLFSTNPERGVYRTRDGGDSWELVHSLTDSTGCVDVAINPQTPSIVYAGMWERIRRPHDRRVGGPTSGIWRSTDAGDNWTLLSNGLPAAGPNVGRIGLAVAPSNPQVVYAIYADHPGFFMGIYKTTDGGDSWSRVNDGSLADMYSSFGWFFGNIRVEPGDENRVYALGLRTHRSTNGGNSWTTIGSSIHVDQHDLLFHPLDPSLMIAGNDGGIYTSLNNGGSWTKSLNLPVSQFYAITVDFQFPERLYGGTQDNSTMRTLTGALDDWEIILGGDGFYCNVDPINNSYIYAEWQWGNLNRSTNGGVTFSSATTGIPSGERRNWSTPVIMDPNDNQTLYYGTSKVYRTTNRAGSWSAISSDLTNGPGGGSLQFGTITTIAVAPTDPQTILAGTDDANVWITTDGGVGWSQISSTLPRLWCTRVAFDPLDASTVYATFSGYRENLYTPHVFRSTNLGVDWTDVSSNLPEVPVNVILIDPEATATLYVGTDAGVYVSANLGESWAALGSGLPGGVVSDLHLHNPTRTLVAGTHGRSMWSIDLGATTAVAAAGSPNQPTVLVGAQPNPFRTETTIVAHPLESGHVRVGIYDVNGRLIDQLVDRELAAGQHVWNWDGRTASGAQAARGVYFVRFEAGTHVEVAKVMLER